MADPGTVIRVTTSIASSLLRGIASLFGGKPIEPYVYYRLGSLVERFRVGGLIGIPLKARDEKWRIGFRAKTANHTMMTQINLFFGRISVLAPLILNKKRVFSYEHKWDMDFLTELTPEKEQYWEWIELGRAEYRDRWVENARAIIGEDPDTFLGKYDKARSLMYQNLMMLREMPIPPIRKQYEAAKAAYDKLDGLYQQKLPALQQLWKKTDPAPALKSAQSAKNELTRWVGMKAVSLKKATVEAMWFGPPVPWAMEIAARSYGQYGAAAILRYLSVSPETARDMLRIMQVICPAGLGDPVIASFLQGVK